MKEKKIKTALLTVAMGCWLIAIGLTFCATCTPILLSDILCGLFLVLLGVLSLSKRRVWSGWAVGLLGVWLQCAPLLFWSPSAVIYLNDTLIGAIAIIFSFILTDYPDKHGGETWYPKGWSYNPSAWKHRIPTVGLALLCSCFARYMAAYQLGYITTMWDPFFSHGTMDVITSPVSHSFPVSDAGLGALCYTLEMLLGWQGGVRRFATMPWLVFSFAFLIIPVGIVSTVLIILQPIVVGAWCSWCLATAVCMLAMILLTAGEFAAVLQLLAGARKRGKSVFQLFWKGTSSQFDTTPVRAVHKRLAPWGVGMPWNLTVSALLGLALMVLPGVITVSHDLAVSDYIIGPITIVVSVIAMAEVFRALRYCLIALGAWLIIAPLAFAVDSTWIASYHLVTGALLFIFAMRKGCIKEHYGEMDRFIF